MTAILDTSFLYALADQGDRNHPHALAAAQNSHETLVLPNVILPEICYLIASRLSHKAMRSFVASLTPDNVQLEGVSLQDLARIHEVLEQYSDSELDFADTAIIAIAERLTIKQIYTFDRRDFSIIRPKHCDYFDLLP